MRYLINFFQKKKVFFYTMIIVATSKEDIVRTFSYVSLIIKKRDRNSTFLVKKWKKFVFTKKIMFFYQRLASKPTSHRAYIQTQDV